MNKIPLIDQAIAELDQPAGNINYVKLERLVNQLITNERECPQGVVVLGSTSDPPIATCDTAGEHGQDTFQALRAALTCVKRQYISEAYRRLECYREFISERSGGGCRHRDYGIVPETQTVHVVGGCLPYAGMFHIMGWPPTQSFSLSEMVGIARSKYGFDNPRACSRCR